MNDWTWANGSYDIAYRESDDPRILEVIERDTDAQGPDGDAYAPAYWLEYRGAWSNNGRAGAPFEDDDKMEAYVTALNTFGRRGNTAERFMRIFHDTTVEVLSGYDGSLVVLLNTPAFRTHVGLEDENGVRALNGAGEPIADEIALSLEGERDDYQAWINGEVFGIGHAVNTARTMPDAELNFEDFDVEIEVWGFYGEEYAKGSLQDIEWPRLDLMLDIPA